MNKTLPRSRYLAAPPATDTGLANANAANRVLLSGAPVDDDARRMTSLILAVTRRLLAVDDRAAELPLRQLRVCMVLHDGARSMSALSRELGVSLSAMTQIADRLERAGMVKRSPEQSDRRVRSLQLTARGDRIMRERDDSRIERVTAVVGKMSDKERREVVLALRRLLEACTAA